jgi:hypothetical protein
MDIRPTIPFDKGLSALKNLASEAKDAVEPGKKVLNRSLDEIGDTLGGLLDKIKPQPLPLPGKPDFGKLGRLVDGSPLIEFLGSLSTMGTSREPEGVNTSGSQIPGGPRLYDTGKGMFHKGAPGAPDTYAFENTPEGIKFAAENGYASIDLDMHITKDGHLVATHYAQPMKKDGFYDPSGKLDKNTKVKDMTLAEVMRLRNEDGQSQIYPMSTMIKELKKHGIAGDLEAKNDPRFADDKVMRQLADMVREAGIEANLKSIDYGPRTYDVLEAAQAEGFWVRTAKGQAKKARRFGYGANP